MQQMLHLLALSLSLALPAATAVAQQPAVPGSAPAAADNMPAAPTYRVMRGDELNFRFIYTPELNTVAVVRSDGRISLPLVGDLLVQDRTVQELIELVERRLSEQVRRPQVVVNVSGAGSQRVFVGGEVAKPGVQPLVGPLTAMQAVMAAEGLRDTAQPAEVLVLRRAGPGRPSEVIRVNLADVLAGKPDAQDPLLQAYDMVVVPRSGIASVNLWVDQYLRRTLPFTTGFSYSINSSRQLTQ